MKISLTGSMRRWSVTARERALMPLIALAAAASFATPALASLGGDVASVQADIARMKGTLHISSTAGFAVHETTTAAGTAVREYLSPSGRVFAVSWRGPRIPDLKQLLGVYFDQFAQAPSAKHVLRRQRVVEQPDLVVQSTGYMRAFFGRAWVPSLVPPNFSVSDIR